MYASKVRQLTKKLKKLKWIFRGEQQENRKYYKGTYEMTKQSRSIIEDIENDS